MDSGATLYAKQPIPFLLYQSIRTQMSKRLLVNFFRGRGSLTLSFCPPAPPQPSSESNFNSPFNYFRYVCRMEVGRPSIFTQELADKICIEIATSSKSLRTICKSLNISVGSVLNWLKDKDKHEFLTQYARAKEEQADFLAEEMMEIADDASNDFMTITKGDASYEVENREWTARSKLRVDTRKWIASKLKPKKYGEKLEVQANVTNIPEIIIPGAKPKEQD